MPPGTQATEVGDHRKLPRLIRRVSWIVVAVFALIQLIPYGHGHSNPPITGQPAWDSVTTRALVGTACFDCHSNQTQWYWYTNVAPLSWFVQHDVEEGRGALNFSEWDRPQDGTDEMAETIREGSMPPWYYYAVHWSARLSPNEQTQLIAGLERTFQASPPVGEG
jgi:hypothetical protein